MDELVVDSFVTPLLNRQLRAAYSLSMAVVRQRSQRCADKDSGREDRDEVNGC